MYFTLGKIKYTQNEELDKKNQHLYNLSLQLVKSNYAEPTCHSIAYQCIGTPDFLRISTLFLQESLEFLLIMGQRC